MKAVPKNSYQHYLASWMMPSNSITGHLFFCFNPEALSLPACLICFCTMYPSGSSNISPGEYRKHSLQNWLPQFLVLPDWFWGCRVRTELKMDLAYGRFTTSTRRSSLRIRMHSHPWAFCQRLEQNVWLVCLKAFLRSTKSMLEGKGKKTDP